MISGIGYNATPPADYNGDGDVTISDILLLLQQISNN
jgi:hypothetical protein